MDALDGIEELLARGGVVEGRDVLQAANAMRGQRRAVQRHGREADAARGGVDDGLLEEEVAGAGPRLHETHLVQVREHRGLDRRRLRVEERLRGRQVHDVKGQRHRDVGDRRLERARHGVEQVVRLVEELLGAHRELFLPAARVRRRRHVHERHREDLGRAAPARHELADAVARRVVEDDGAFPGIDLAARGEHRAGLVPRDGVRRPAPDSEGGVLPEQLIRVVGGDFRAEAGQREEREAAEHHLFVRYLACA
mmetsp:Transcript_5173/g.15379  ORF Transcript_5173/g.15379 Transcript_5173/m.15379 type:complete len:253 (-) Transcript_5173:31-789(-)